MVGKRKYESGHAKRQKRDKQQKLIQSQKGVMKRYLTPNTPTVEVENLNDNVVDGNNDVFDDNNVVDDNDDVVENNVNVVDAKIGLDENLNELNIENKEKNDPEISETENIDDSEQVSEYIELINKDLNDIYDPGNWEINMHQKKIDLLVEKGPIRVKDFVYPVNDIGRCFSDKFYTRTLLNGEKVDREWLVYSKKINKVFCFCCVLFRKGSSSNLTKATIGFNDWRNIGQRLKEHENSNDHANSWTEWTEAEVRLKKKLTIDASNQKEINKEREFWREVLKRIMYVVEGLATNNIAFRGCREKIDDDHNGNFLGIIKMIAKFDPIMEEHIRRIRNKKNRRAHYLGHNIQNEMILILANEVKKRILEVVRNAKYFSVILDCTPDISHEEQMTLILRCVDVSKSPIIVEEFFIEFIKVNETSGEALFNDLKAVLEVLNLNLNNVIGQGYDNGSNMKGQYKGVRSRVLEKYPRAFYTPCSCHSLNLALSDMATSSNEASSFFGVVQRIYKLFSGSTKRWDILKRYIKDPDGKGFTLKLWSDTRWESRVTSVKAIISQAPQIRDALLYIAKHGGELTLKNDADTLVEVGFERFDFLVGMVIWFDILRKVNKVSKVLQKKDMNIDIAIDHLNGLIFFFKEYRKTGFENAILEAEKIALKLKVEPKFRETRVRYKKKFFDENAIDEPVQMAVRAFKVNYFLKVVDSAISTLKTRFDQFTEYDRTFGFLFKLNKLRTTTDEELKSSCKILGKYLKHDDSSYVDADEFYSELQILRKALPEGISKAFEVLDYINDKHVLYPNAWVAYRILLTIPVTVATAERSFSKLKLIKNYLRSTMSQERLNGLATLSIEKKILAKLEIADLLTNFAHQKARRITI